MPGGEIGSMFVRIRPDVRSFGPETTAAVKKSLIATQADFDSMARSNVQSAASTLEANRQIVTSYDRMSRDVTLTGKERRIADQLSVESAQRVAESVGATVSQIVDARAREVTANLDAARSYREVAAAAKHGSVAEAIATREAVRLEGLGVGAVGSTVAGRHINQGKSFAGFRSLFASAGEGEKELGKATRGALAGSGAFEHLGRSLAFASGGFLAFASGTRILHDSLVGAASVQKSIEVIRANLGSAAESVVKFGDRAAYTLGISADVADSTSARFAILFKNLGIGTQESAGMTLGFEKLAGSISRIRGIDPSQVFAAITTAAAGNSRGLQQLGIAITQTAVKQEALKLGLISTIHQAIDPATRAEATYAIATKNLGLFMLEAQKHTHDFADIQRTLSAEFSNVKDTLGNALLPIFVKYGGELANWLQRMQESGKLQRDFNDIAHTTVAVVKDVARALNDGWIIFKTAAGWVGGTKNAIEILLGVIAVTKLAGIGRSFIGIATSIAGIGRAAQAMAVRVGVAFGTVDAEAVATAATIDAALISTGIGAVVVAFGLAVGYIITHWARVKTMFADFGHWIEHLFQEIESTIVGIFKKIVGVIGSVLAAIPSWLPGLGKFHDWGERLQKWASDTGSASGRSLGGAFGTSVVGAMGKAGAAAGTAYSASFKDAIGRSMNTTAKDSIGRSLIPPGFLKAEIAQFNKQFVSLPNVVPLKIQLELAQAHTPEATKRALQDELAALRAELRQHLTATDRIQVEQEKSGVLDQLKGLADAAAQAAGAAATSTGDIVASALSAAKQKIAAAIQEAKANMVKLGNDLASQIDKLMVRLHKTTLGGGQLSDAMKGRLAELIQRVGAGEADNLTFKLAGELANQINQKGLGDKGSLLDQLKARIGNVVDEFNKGALTVKAFHSKLNDVLSGIGVSAGQIQKTEGVAAADRFRADVKALVGQAQALAATPGAFSQASDLAPKIIRPLEVIRQQDQRIAAASARQRAHQLTESKKHTKLLQKIAAGQPSKKDSQALRDLIAKQNPAATDAASATKHRHNH